MDNKKQKTTQIWIGIHTTIACTLLPVFLLLAFLSMQKIKSLEQFLFFATTSILLFYFWWGYLYLGLKGIPSSSLVDYLLDFLCALLLVSLLVLPSLPSRSAPIWFLCYAGIMILALVKYIKILKTSKKGQDYIRFKMKLHASGLILAIILSAVALEYPVAAIGILLLVIVGHLAHVSLSGFYEKHLRP